MVDFTPRAVVVAAREWVREGREVNRVDRRVRAG